MKTFALSMAISLSSVFAAHAWQFDLRNDRGLYHGVLWSYDLQGEALLSATCWPGERIALRLDALAPSIPQRVDGVGRIVGGSAALLPYQSQTAPSFSVLPIDGRSGESALDAIASARRAIDVSWQGMLARFDASDARAAVMGFRRICESLPRAPLFRR